MNKDFNKHRDVSILRLLGLRDQGRRVTIRCPFHNDSTPSFSIYPENSFYCFGCGAKGQGAIDFLLLTGASFKEVIKELDNYV